MQTTVEPATTPASAPSPERASEPALDAEPHIVVIDAAAMKRAAKAALTTVTRTRSGDSLVYQRALLVNDALSDTVDLYATDGHRAIRWRMPARTTETRRDAGETTHCIALDQRALRELAECPSRTTAGSELIRTVDGGGAYRLTPKTGNPRKTPWKTCPGSRHLDAASLERIFSNADKTSAWDLIGVTRTALVDALKNLPETPHGLVRLSHGAQGAAGSGGPPTRVMELERVNFVLVEKPGRTNGNGVLELRATNSSTIGPAYAPEGTVAACSATTPRPTPICVSGPSLRKMLTRMSGRKVDIRLPYKDEPVMLIARGGDETAVLQQQRFDSF